MIVFVHGADSFRSHEKLKELLGSEKLGIRRIDGEDMRDARVLIDATRTPSLFAALAPQQLIVVNGLFTANKSKTVVSAVVEAIESGTIPSSAQLIFYEAVAIAKTTLVAKRLLKQKSIQNFEFVALAPRQMESWARERFGRVAPQVDVEPQAVVALVAACGQDMWKLASEIEKLAAFAGFSGKITRKEVDLLVSALIAPNIFDFVDALGAKQMRRALELLHQHLDVGEEPLYLLSMMVYQFRNLLQVKSLLEDGVLATDVAKRAGLHPFVASKAVAQANKFSLSALLVMYQKLHDADVRMKSGKGDAVLMLDSFTVAACR